MPRIVMINTVLNGSHGRLMADIGLAAAREGFSVTRVFGRGDGADGAVRIGSRRDVLAHVALTRLLDRHARGSRAATRAFVEALNGLRPDIVHLHNVHGYYLHAETLFEALRARGVPILWTLHDCWAFTGHCSHFVRANCIKWQAGCHDCPLGREYPASLWLDASRENWRWKRKAFAGQKTLTVATPSKWLYDLVAQSFLQDAPRIAIPNGIDLSLFQPVRDAEVRARHGVREGQVMLLAVAAPFDRRKGFDDALAVARLLGSKARVVLVGLNDGQLGRLPPNVTGVKRTDGPEALVSLYGAADCLINPTYEDTYPTVNMEAMACGTPVAAYDTGGCGEQLAPGVGRATPAGDAERLAEAAMALAAQKAGIAGACRAHAERFFDRRRAVEAYVAQYKKMMGA